MKKRHFIILECKVNAYETEAMQEMLEQAGYRDRSRLKKGSDVYSYQYMHGDNIADR